MDKIKEITTERNGDYGHCLDQFNATQEMYKIWKKRRSGGLKIDPELENVLSHIIYLMVDKMVRLAQNPHKQDGYDDIQGYASLWDKSVKELAARRRSEDEEGVDYESATD